MKKSFPIILLALVLVSVMLACVLVACGPGNGPDTPTTESTTEDPTTEPGTTETETETETEPGDTSTEESTTEPVVPEIKGVVADFNAISQSSLEKCFSGANQVEVSYGQDDDGEVYVALTTTGASSDPFVNFSYKKFSKAEQTGNVSADEYKYVMLKVRSVGCSSGTFELFYCAGAVTGATGGIMTTSSFDLENTGWQYVLFDLSAVDHWSGNVNGFRFDYMTGAQGAGETLHIAEIQFLESDDAYYKMFDIGWDEVGVIAGEQAKTEAEKLLGSITKPTTKYDSYTPETADKEDASLNLWFDNLYNRTPQTTNTSNGKLTYQIQLAKNEIEGCQVLIGSANGAEGLKVYISDFTNAQGDTLKTQLYWGYYFNVDGERVIDPLPPVTYTPEQGMLEWVNGGNGGGEQMPLLQKYDGFDIKAGENQAFIIKATSLPGSAAGEYTATLTVMDKDGNEVKKVTVFAYVWNFELPEATSCKTLMSLGAFDIYLSYKDWGGDLRNSAGKNLYQGYYDFLLANRVCAYDLPFDNADGTFSANGIVEYLDNPRVVAFQPLGFSKPLNGTNVTNAYNFLSQKQEWLDKAYFYPVDEPLTVQRLDDINNYGKLLTDNFPGYKLIVPMHVNYNVTGGDYFSYVSEYVNVWCPKTFFYNTFAEWYNDRTLTYGCSIITEQKLGSFRDRMWEEQKNGDELWWYVTRRPSQPEITLIIDTDAVNLRTIFWQQKLYNVDGFLYYLVNDWTNGTTKWYVPSAEGEFMYGMDALHEVSAENNVDVYGNGILLYSGVYFAQTDPVGSLRLECVRDGIEDFEYLTILEEKYGKDVVDAIINEWTTGVGEYSTDTEQFNALRAKLGALAEAAANN